MDVKRKLLFFGIITWLLAAAAWTRGDTRLAFLLISPTPVFFIGWGMSALLQSSRQRELVRNLTGREREQLEAMSAQHGKWLAVSCGLPTGLAVLLAHRTWANDAVTIAVLVACILATLPFAIRRAAPMRRFMEETAYARATVEK